MARGKNSFSVLIALKCAFTDFMAKLLYSTGGFDHVRIKMYNVIGRMN